MITYLAVKKEKKGHLLSRFGNRGSDTVYILLTCADIPLIFMIKNAVKVHTEMLYVYAMQCMQEKENVPRDVQPIYVYIPKNAKNPKIPPFNQAAAALGPSRGSPLALT